MVRLPDGRTRRLTAQEGARDPRAFGDLAALPLAVAPRTCLQAFAHGLSSVAAMAGPEAPNLELVGYRRGGGGTGEAPKGANLNLKSGGP